MQIFFIFQKHLQIETNVKMKHFNKGNQTSELVANWRQTGSKLAANWSELVANWQRTASKLAAN
jgi:homoserine trans-succinylase